jgi:hypothetical protein
MHKVAPGDSTDGPVLPTTAVAPLTRRTSFASTVLSRRLSSSTTAIDVASSGRKGGDYEEALPVSEDEPDSLHEHGMPVVFEVRFRFGSFGARESARVEWSSSFALSRLSDFSNFLEICGEAWCIVFFFFFFLGASLVHSCAPAFGSFDPK